METSHLRKRMPASALSDAKIVLPAIGSAFVKLNPWTLMSNPVMFVLEIVTALTTVILIRDLITGGEHIGFSSRSSCGCGSRCCSPTSPKPWPKAAARRRPTLRRQRTETQAKRSSIRAEQRHRAIG
jgi:K+-transporting ATPase ATPase B chain